MAKQAVFLDQDGTINKEVGYLDNPAQLKLLPGAAKAIKALNGRRLLVIVASNQSGIARGYFTEEDLERIHQKLKGELAKKGAFIDAIYYCPHHSEIGDKIYKKACRCRKPNPGMLEKAALDFDLNLRQSYLVGDKVSDIEAGHRVGCKTVLVRTGYGEETIKKRMEWVFSPTFVAADLAEATKWILKDCSI